MDDKPLVVFIPKELHARAKAAAAARGMTLKDYIIRLLEDAAI